MIRLCVKEILESKGISIAKIARRADLDDRTVYCIIHDPFAEITTVTLGRLAEALGVSVKDLIEDAPNSIAEKQSQSP